MSEEVKKSIADLLGDLGDFGTAGVRKDGNAKIDANEKFIENCAGDIEALRTGNPHKGAMFLARDPSKGTGYVVTLRSGVKKIKLGRGMDHMICPTNERAIEFLTKVMNLAIAGELDSLLNDQAIRYAKY